MLIVDQMATHVRNLCQATFRAYHAFVQLDGVNTELRGLSFNAEIACVRGGQDAVAVRPLAQYTRELADGLMATSTEVERLRLETHRSGALALQTLSPFGLHVEAAERLLLAASKEESDAIAHVSLAHIKRVMPIVIDDTLEKVQALVGTVRQLETLTAAILDAVRQARSIANQIAIQAAGTGKLEREFTLVAAALHKTVDKFGTMTDDALAAVRDALRHAARIDQARSQARSDKAFRTLFITNETRQ